MNKNSLYKLLNIHAAEAPVVFRLLGIQAVLGLATAFLSSSSYALFLYHFPITNAPKVYLLAAFILFPVNALYARMDLKLNSKKLLQLSIVFAAVSMGLLLILWVTIQSEWLVLLLVAWNLMLYMVVGYAYWGLASLLFNVRESRRIFSVIGAGDLPAKAGGYYVVAVLSSVTGINAIMAAAIVFFLIAFFLCKKLFSHSAIDWESYESESHHVTHEPTGNWSMRFFKNKLIQWISALSLVAYMVFYIVEFTFLSEVKIRYKSAHELASFIGLFLATGRLVSIFVKLLFTSRLINRLGLVKSLLITPVLILLIAFGVLLMPMADPNGKTYLYAFGLMAIFCEVLRNTIQEPVFFILFQPLNIHLRLKGHLVAKGYVFPPALLIVGTGLSVSLYLYDHISITTILWVVASLIMFWLFTIRKISLHYFDVVQRSIQKGFFSGIALFLNEDSVIDKLLKKTRTGKALERIHALNLLERSNFDGIENLMNELLLVDEPRLQHYILKRIQHYHYAGSLDRVWHLKNTSSDFSLIEAAYQTICLLDNNYIGAELNEWHNLNNTYRKLLLISACSKTAKQEQIVKAEDKLFQLALSQQEEDQLLSLYIIEEVATELQHRVLASLRQNELPDNVYNRLLDVAGKLEAIDFLPEIWQALAFPKYKQNALLALNSLKEKLFEALPPLTELTINALEHLAVIAGKTKNQSATAFLLSLLRNNSISPAVITNSLWQQQYSETPVPGSSIYEQTSKIIAQLVMKKELWHRTDNLNHSKLANAIFSEIENDCMAVFQLLAIQYGRQKLVRVIEIMEMRQYGRMHNAIELLELSIPRNLFLQLQDVLDFITNPKKAFSINKMQEPFVFIASSILGNPAKFNDWTKSLTWWVAARETTPGILPVLASFTDYNQSPILKETKDFVISHNHNLL
ncbi:MAG: hypothetical protein V4717_07860 [Bacteroidota bacterium]